MEDYSYLHIALRGPQDGVTQTLFSFGASDEASSWVRATVDPAAAMSRFLNARECYVMQAIKGRGHYFSYIVPTESADKDYRMICMLIDDGCSLTGRRIIAAFEALKKTLVDEQRLSSEAVVEALTLAELPAEPVRLDSWLIAPARPGATPGEAAYRTFMSQTDLETIFSFPAQPEYQDYRCILVVSATTSLRPGVKMPRITQPIRKIYSVVCPEGVTASASQVLDGDTLTITYARDGFTPHSEKVTVGQPSPFTKYDGSTIHIRTATQTGLRFVRRIGVNVISSKGKPVSGYTLTVNGRFLPTIEPVIELSEKDLAEGGDVEIAVQSTNYLPLKVKKSVDDLLHTDLIDLELRPVEAAFTLRLDFGDGRIFEQQITLEKNAPEYTRLHSGYFHGFRAMRQVTDDHTEIYNVDVRPDAPNIGVGHTSANPSAPKQAPVFENVSDLEAPEEERPVIDTSLPSSSSVGLAPPEEDPSTYGRPYSRRASIIKWCVGAIAVIAVVVACVLLIPSGPEYDVTPAEGTSTGAAADTPQAAAPAPLTPEEEADIAYLNENKIWRLSSLQSEMGRSIFKAMEEGDIDALVNNDYFAVGDRCKNAEANKMADLVWRAKGSPSERTNRDRMKRAVKNGEIVVHEAWQSVDRARPAENINTSPRPRK